MNKKIFITTLILGSLFLPMITFAQSSATTTIQATTVLATEAQVFTACSQAAIEIRDSAIGAARTAYNNTMTVALEARKEAEKEAVAMEDAKDKKNAIKEAVEEYKENVTEAQEGLTKARKEAWETFEANTKECRDMSKEKRELETKDIVETEKETDTANATLRSVTADIAEDNAKDNAKTLSDEPETETETKSLRETILDSLKSFFRLD